MQKNKSIKDTIEEYEMLKNDLEEIELLLEMAIEEDDDSLEKDIELSIEKMQYNLDKVRIKTLLDGEYDKNNAILSINAGTGGLDAQDCAQILSENVY